MKFSGSEPYLRMSASWVAWASVKPFGCRAGDLNVPEVSGAAGLRRGLHVAVEHDRGLVEALVVQVAGLARSA